MITARNYAAQCVKQFRGSPDANVRNAAFWFEQAVHFALPDGGRVLDTNFKSIEGVPLNLPYPRITIEYFINSPARGLQTEKCSKRCIMAEQDSKDSDIVFTMAFYADNKDIWGLSPLLLRLKPQWALTAEYLNSITYHTFTRGDEVSAYLAQLPEQELRSFFIDFVEEFPVILSLCEALSCQNITTETLEQINPEKNAKRVKSGKLPIYETKILVLKTPQEKNTSQSKGGAHASPRQHLRRGHIRRLPKGNVWINSCVVGDPSKGMIDKSYQVTGRDNARD